MKLSLHRSAARQPAQNIPELELNPHPRRFSLDLVLSFAITFIQNDYLQDNLRSLTSDASRAVSKGTEASWHDANSNVSKILPVTTLRTIDLEGQENLRPFVFWILAKTKSFFPTKCCTTMCAIFLTTPRASLRLCFDRHGSVAARRCFRRGQTRDRPLRRTIQCRGGWRPE